MSRKLLASAARSAVRRKCSAILWPTFLVFLLGSIILLYAGCGFRSTSGDEGGAPVNGGVSRARVERRPFKRSLRVHGTVEAVQSFVVMAPRLSGPGLSTLLITRMARGGSYVRREDVLVEFDMQNQRKIVLDRRAEYRDLVEQIRKKSAQQAADRARQDFELQQARNQVESARLETRKNEVLIRIDAEKNNLNLEEAQARVKELKEILQLRGEAAKAELRILEIQRDRALNAVRYAEQNIERMRVTAPLSGLVVLIPLYKTGRMAEASEGDEIRPGVPFMQVVDPAAMQVRARINQADVYDVVVGQAVEVRLDAFPELVLHGRLERLAAIASSGALTSQSRYVRTFAAVFSVIENHPKLMPDLSAAVDIELDRRSEALVAPRESVTYERGQAFVSVIRDGRPERRPVKVGPANDLEVVVESGVEEGTAIERHPGTRSNRGSAGAQTPAPASAP